MNVTDTDSFFQLVRLLRTRPREIQIMALYAAQCWSEEHLDKKEAAGELPSGPTKSATVLTLVKGD